MEKEKILEKIVKRGIYGVSVGIVGSSAVMMAPITTAATANSATSEINVTLTPVISLGVYSDQALGTEIDTVDLGMITPTADGTAVSNAAYVGVATNDANGYTLKMTMDTTATSTALEPATDGVPTTIAATESAVGSLDDMAKDHWGYKGENVTNYTAPVLAENLSNAPAIKTTNAPNSSMAKDSVAVTFGAKVSTAVAADTYSNTVMFTAVANSSNGS